MTVASSTFLDNWAVGGTSGNGEAGGGIAVMTEAAACVSGGRHQ
jgi:hypothetical protein